MPRKIAVDGMLSGTGVRDLDNGGYIEAKELGLSDGLRSDLYKWLEQYENLKFDGYQDKSKVEQLDQVGLEIMKRIQAELPEFSVGYFSDAKFKHLV